MQLAARDRSWVVDCNSWMCGGGHAYDTAAAAADAGAEERDGPRTPTYEEALANRAIFEEDRPEAFHLRL